MAKFRSASATLVAAAALITSTGTATGAERSSTTNCRQYVCVNVVHSDLHVEKVEVFQNSNGPSWFGHVKFTSNREPQVVGSDGNPVPWVVVHFNRTLPKGTTLCGEALEAVAGGYVNQGSVCVDL
ncbi:hypothetical protein [Saccharothrix sp. HUAS TT1]|uniref:hypothetical protein n=1 Tax=unclassified Saccharothrix TaxID=2593673 RepID=UPI00345BC9B4